MTDEDLARDRAACDPGGNEHFVGDASRRWLVALDEVVRLRAELARSEQRITDLEDALNLAAGALESRSDAMFRRNCAADARRVLRAKVQP